MTFQILIVGHKILKLGPTVSFTGSESVGRIVGKHVQSRFGKVLLELGGNNGSSSSSLPRHSSCITYIVFIGKFLHRVVFYQTFIFITNQRR